MMKRLPWILGSLAVVCLGYGVLNAPDIALEADAQAAQAKTAPKAPSAQVLVGLKAGVQAASIATALNGRVIRHMRDLDCVLVEAPGPARVLADRAAALPGVDYSEVNRSAEPASGRGRCVCQGDPLRAPKALEIFDLALVGEQLRLKEAWLDAPLMGKGILVAVVDTGVERGIPALLGATEPAIDLVDTGGVGIDGHGHGTSMAGIIAGRGDGTKGFRGVAPMAMILPVRVGSDRGGAPIDRVARGITEAADRGARVIYVGLGVRGRSPTLARAIAYARKAGSLVVCPTGNDGLDALRSPAAEPGAFAVGGTSGSRGQALALAANISGDVRLAAPCEFVPAPHKKHVRFTDGTSSAGALVAGVAALVLSKNPALDVDALERALIAGGADISQLRQAETLGRLRVRRLDAAGAVARAGADHSEVVVRRAVVTPNPPQVGRAAKLQVTIANVGNVTLERVDVSATLEGNALQAPPASRALEPGQERTLTFHWKPAQAWAGKRVGFKVRARGMAVATGEADVAPPTPALAFGTATTVPTTKAEPNFAVAGIRVVKPMTLESPTVKYEITIVNRGASTSRGTFQAAVNGKKVHKARVSLAPGGTVTETVTWTAPRNEPPSAPVTLEVYVEAKGDHLIEDDFDTFVISLQDPTLPTDPMYRQDGDIDFGLDAPWRVASDRPYVPLLFFVPSIGRPSRYDTFSETLAMRRGVVARLADNPGTGRRFSGAARRVGVNLATYTTAMFVKELAAAANGDEDAVRKFFDRLMTTDFAIDFGAYAVGAGTGAYLFDRVASRASKIRGLRWTGTNLGGAIARSQATIALGYLLPNLIRGHFDRRVALDLASLGLTTAAMETLAAGVRVGAARVGIAKGTAAWLARHGKIAKAGGFLVNVGQLVLILYASEWISESIDRPWIKFDAKRAMRSAYADLDKAATGRFGNQDAFDKALRAYEDSFDAYRNIIAYELESELRELNTNLKDRTREIFQEDLANKRAAETLRRRNLAPLLRASIERSMASLARRSTQGLKADLAEFEKGYGEALESLYDHNATATLADPGDSKPAVFDLEVALLEGLIERAQGDRKETLQKKLATLRRLRALDASIAEALLANASTSGAPVRPVTLAGNDGLVLKRITVTARSSWHFMTNDREKIFRQPNKWAPEGSVKETVIYEHDIDRELYWAAPGVQRINENAEHQESVALFDAPRPLTMKGRYNILRLPRELLAQIAVGNTAYLYISIDWELNKVVRGSLVRPAEGTQAQMLYVYLGEKGLPMLPGVPGGYLDAHYHTIAEWYNPEPGFVADLEVDAPRQKYGGPIPMLVESAYAVGAIEGATYGAARDKLVTTDHNGFYVPNDGLAHRPPFGPTSLGASKGLTEHQRMRQLLGESAGEELCYSKPGLTSVGVHMLDYRAKHYDGTWNARQPITTFWRRWTQPMEMPTMERILGEFAEGAEGNENSFAYASHPVSSIPWENEKLVAALGEYTRAGDKSFPFKGLQVWNQRSGRSHSYHGLYKYLENLNPFVSTTWQAGQSFDTDIHGAMVKYRHLVRMFSDFRHPRDPSLRMIRKLYMVAGSDSHGDFNYTVGGTATAITALAGVNDTTDDFFELLDSAFMKIRTFVNTEGFEAPERMTALAHGSSAVTDGPLIWFEIDGDGRFDAKTGTYSANAAPSFKEGDGKIGGSGDWDGGRTVLLANDAVPVIRYSYTNYDEFGRPTRRDKLGRVLRRDGSITTIGIYKTDLEGGGALAGSGKRFEANGTLDTKGGRAFGNWHEEALNPEEEGLVQSVSAIQLGAFSSVTVETSPADVFRCITNPVWAVSVTITAHIDPAKFDAATGVIAPGGLRVELNSPISLASDKIPLVVRPLNAEGVTFGRRPLATLTPEGWATGTDTRDRSYKNGIYLAFNEQPIQIKGLPTFGQTEDGKPVVTLVVMTRKAPRDAFGNKLNRIAATFQVDPVTGAPGENADTKSKAELPEVRFVERRGIIDVMGE